KRVDYSARSVIVVGPELQLHQCGLPKKIALELFQPFIIRKLKEHGLADTIKSAKRMLERRDPEVWDILGEVIHQHPVLLNRAPTLHRMGIQAFEPVLVEGNAIKVHPLVCTGFNADFDGDQMAVHLPLSVEAQAEAHVLMLSTHNIFSPANGKPIISPSQDIVLGAYFLTIIEEDASKEENGLKRFKDRREAMLAFEHGKIGIHEPISVRIDGFKHQVTSQGGGVEPLPKHKRLVTTAGRVLFSDILDAGMPYYNCALGKKGTARVIDDTYAYCGRAATIDLLDRLKATGFKWSTLAGISFGVTDLRIPEAKHTLIAESEKKAERVRKNYDRGIITERERYNQLLDIWAHCREQVTKSLIDTLKRDRREPGTGAYMPIDDKGKGKHYLNPVYLMSDSGARGNVSQMQQLAGMRGLMAKPSGEIIETPIRANFREGLNVLEYFSSTHGARKGLADTALKTADSGYLTRKLCDVAQSLIINEHDCKTKRGITKRALYKGEEVDVPLRDQIAGRVARTTITHPVTDEVIVRENEQISDEAARRIETELNIDAVQVRSLLTCDSPRGACALCYGRDLSTNRLVEQGLAVGIIAAQSIGEPGTQLTMRTFHTGGVATTKLVETDIRAAMGGTVELRDCNEVTVKDEDGKDVIVALKRNGECLVLDDRGRELEKYKVPYGAEISVASGTKVKKGDQLVRWDPHRTPILAEKDGFVKFVDIELNETVREEDAGGGKKALVVIEHKGEKHPAFNVVDKDGHILDFHYLPAKARIEVADGQEIKAGQMLARQPRGSAGSHDITGGLPRVTEIFEARKPKDPAQMAEISGAVEIHSDKRKGKMTIRVISEGGIEKDHHVPQDRQLLVHSGDHVIAGEQLIDGPLDPHDILKIKGEEALYDYMLGEVQNVYRAQGVTINDKHIEAIMAQMLRKVKVETAGDTDLLSQEVVDKFMFRAKNAEVGDKAIISDAGETGLNVGAMVTKSEIREANAKAEAEGKTTAKAKRPRPATGRTLLLGITKASLQSESFLSGASFQETTKVLTEASLRGATDQLIGLKENVLLGHLIPAGTGFRVYQNLEIAHLAEPPATEMEDEGSMLAEAAEAAEALGAERDEPTTLSIQMGEILIGESKPAVQSDSN
ncbi:MAG: DNA-directed RNA polymerase subunit beta', partial [Phycisphaerales bacterium]|nr:DNA-directed RNA polymerase subunit beta' [Phycisphaerales bacterium]